MKKLFCEDHCHRRVDWRRTAAV